MLQWLKHDEATLSNKKQKGDVMHTSILLHKPFNWFSNFKYKKKKNSKIITNYIVKVIQNIYDMTKNVIGWHFKNIINKCLNYLFVINDTSICKNYSILFFSIIQKIINKLIYSSGMWDQLHLYRQKENFHTLPY